MIKSPRLSTRYALGAFGAVLRALRILVEAERPERVLEAGCGTGHWLSKLSDVAPRAYGIDYSREMLRVARGRDLALELVQATAEMLPFRAGSFDLIFCVNAVHHFERTAEFAAEARRLLRPDGLLAVIGMDPHHGRDCWCVYDYFPETRMIDLARYPSSGQIADAMLRAGFARVDCRMACRFEQTRVGRDVLDDPELQRNGCSQMALLTDRQYAAGIDRIKSAIALARGRPGRL
jgi:ubiquinone/menaquinone biosynthesis C-methylase UbiE